MTSLDALRAYYYFHIGSQEKKYSWLKKVSILDHEIEIYESLNQFRS